ncbi:MAG: response regulator [Candidatus Symbiothrix sp.]|nr:response regulator [Candidatus Symbiothrix sp.]
MMLKKYLFLLMLLLGCLPETVAQAFSFRHFDIADGLSNNTVKCITQDEQGFVWFGTFYGLCRFDGINFTVYTHRDNDSFSIVGNSITSLVATQEGVFVGTLNGLDFFSVTENRICHCRQMLPTGESLPMNKEIKSVMATNNNIFVLNASGEILKHCGGCDFELCDYNINGLLLAICDYREGMIVAQTSDALYLIDAKNHAIISELVHKTMLWDDNNLYYSRNTNLIFAGYGIGHATDVFGVDSISNQITKSNFHAPADVKTVFDYKDATLFGTDGKGLICLRQGKTTSCTPLNSDISSDAIHALFADREGNLWVGTYRGGANLYSTHYEWFRTLSEKSGQLTHKIVTAVVADDRQIYIGLDGGGLNVYDCQTGKTTVYNSRNSAIAGDNILSLIADSPYVWMGIYGKGLCRFSPDGKSFKTYALPSINGTVNPNYIWAIRSDSEGNIWIVGRDVYVFNIETETFTAINALKNAYSSGIVFDKEHIWVSSGRSGLYQLDRNTRKVIRRYSYDSKESPLISNDIRYLYQDSENNIWFSAQYEGLFKLDKSNDSIIAYGEKESLTDKNVTAMAEDAAGYYWIGTQNGFFRFNPKTETFIRFGKGENLSATQFNYNACYQHNGTLYFGTTDGLIYFEPAKIKYTTTSRQVYFTRLQLLNDAQTIDLSAENRNEIRLSYRQNFFSIDFTVPELQTPDKIFFACMMRNFEPNWRDVRQQRQVVYTNVSPGKYVFCVRMTDCEGQWNDHFASLSIVIDPPWWRTVWAYCLWALLFCGGIYLIYRFYRREMAIKSLVRVKEIEKDMEKELERNISEQKLRFFTNISHEFRTPLSLILSPLDALIRSTDNEVLRSKLSKIYKNAKDLLHLVNQLLDFKKLEMQGEKLKLAYGDLVEFLDTVFLTFKDIADDEQKDLNLSVKMESLYMVFDHDKVWNILNNLLSNAFKYTESGAQITLSVKKTTIDGRSYAHIQVSDTGKGISAEKLPHIFDRFYQVENTKSSTQGSGIGLHLVKEYINMHEGKIEVESFVEQGSTFSVYLPVDLKADSPAHVAPEPAPIEREDHRELPTNNDANQKTLLIVEDNDEFRQFLTEQLENSYRIVSATDGEEGEQQALKESPDLIISDIIMPKVDGVELCHRIKDNISTSHIPIILLTARASDESKLSGYGAGADEYISKPFNFDILLLRIQKLIAQQEARKDQFRKAVEINPSEITITSLDAKLIQKVLSFIEKNMSNTEYFIDDLSKDIGMGKTNLYRKIQSITGLSPAQFIRSIRLKRAAQLLHDTQLNVSEIADMVGFSTIKYFNIHFKDEFELTPTQYRQQKK